MNNLKNRLIIMVLIIVVVGVLGILTREAQTLQWMIENENRMRDFVKQYPWQGWLLGFAVYTLFSSDARRTRHARPPLRWKAL